VFRRNFIKKNCRNSQKKTLYPADHEIIKKG